MLYNYIHSGQNKLNVDCLLLEEDKVADCRKLFWETRDAKLALEKLPKNRSIESQLLRGLAAARHKNDFLSAITSVSVYFLLPAQHRILKRYTVATTGV